MMKAPWPIAQALSRAGIPCLGTPIPHGWHVDPTSGKPPALYNSEGQLVFPIIACRVEVTTIVNVTEWELDHEDQADSLCYGCGFGGCDLD